MMAEEYDLTAAIEAKHNTGRHGPCQHCGKPSCDLSTTEQPQCFNCYERMVLAFSRAEARQNNGAAIDWEHVAETAFLPDDDPRRLLIDWPAFWAQNHTDEEWVAWPVIPAHRQIAIYSPAKEGKSVLLLAAVAAVATGRPIFGQPNQAGPRHVLYLDYEMTQDDLRERLEEMDYGPDDNLDHLHYASLPSLPALNTPDGAKAVLQLAQTVTAELVVVDTLARAVEGDENSADTVNEFYRWTGLALKANRIGLVRADHAGKNLERGQRGSSAKSGDVDVVWQLTRADGGYTLKRTHSRISWVRDTVNVAYTADPYVTLTVAADLFDAGTKECVDRLDALGLPVDISTRIAQAALKEAGHPTRRKIVTDATRYRREGLGITLGISGSQLSGTTLREPLAGTTNPETNGDQARNHFGNQSEPPSESRGGGCSHVVGTTRPDPHFDEDF